MLFVASKLRTAVVLLCAAAFVPGLAYAQRDRLIRPIHNERRVVLKGNRNPQAQPQNDQGPVEPDRQISGMTLLLKQSAEQKAALEKLLEEQQDPASPNYHAWLTPEEYADRFGVSANDWAGIHSWLYAQGFRVDYSARGRNFIAFSGTARQAQDAFGTQIHVYRADGETHYANATDPTIPAALEPVVQAIQGLDDFRLRPRRPARRPRFSDSGESLLTPEDLATIYNIIPLYQTGIDGSGQKLVIVGQSGFDMADIRTFRSAFGLPANDPQVVLAAGSADPGISDSLGEALLDLEWAGAVAKNATIVYVYGTDVYAAVFYAVDQNLAPVISMSWGACEPLVSSVSSSLPNTIRTVAQQANSQGITWVASSGDSGAADCERQQVSPVGVHGMAADFPASMPEVTGVGGTEFNEGSGNYWNTSNTPNLGSARSYIPEKVWNDTALDGGLVAGGGGASIFFSRPSWQTGPGVPNDSARSVPDIAFTASADHVPYVIFQDGDLQLTGGTSAAAPVFGGILALLNQYVVAKGFQSNPGLANVNPNLYRLAQIGSGIFHDVTVGDNIVPCQAGTLHCGASGRYGYAAGPGYDRATGLGSADVYKLITGWNATSVTSTTTTVAANPASFAVSASTTLTATVKAASGTVSPGGTVTFSLSEATLGTGSLSGSAGTSTASVTVNGSQLSTGGNSITATYGGVTGFGSSNGSVTVTVTAPVGGPTTTTLAANPSTVSPAGSTTLTATVRASSGTTSPPGSVAFLLGNVTLGNANLTGSGGTSTASVTVSGSQLAAGGNTISATYGGGDGFGGSVGNATVTVTVPATATTTVVAANPSSISAGGNTVVVATVGAVSGSASPVGSVTFTVGGTTLGTGPLAGSGGVSTASIAVNGSQLAVGSNTIGASYAGGNNFGASSGSVTVTVGTGASSITSTSLSANPGSITTGTSTTLTATVTAASGTPIGQVSFALGDVSLGTATLAGSGATSTGSLTVAGSRLAVGPNTVTAFYGGGSGFNGSSGAAQVTVSLPSSGSAVIPSVVPNPVYQQEPDEEGFSFFFTLRLSEIAGVATTLKTFTVTFGDGAGSDYTDSIQPFFGSANLSAKGTLSAALRAKATSTPANWLFNFTGEDANGQPWTQQISVPLMPQQIAASMLVTSSPGTVVQNPNGTAGCDEQHKFFYQQLNLQEQNGYEVQLTKFLAVPVGRSAIDLSGSISQYFHSWRLAPLGTLQAGICWQIGSAPTTLNYQIEGVDTAGNQITTTATTPFNPAPSQSGGALGSSVKSVNLTVSAGQSGSAGVGVEISAGQPWSATLFPANQKSSWLVVYPQSGTGPGPVNLVASAAGLGTGVYTATLVLQSVNTIPQFVNVPITFTVGSLGNVSIDGITNTFSYQTTFAPGMLLSVYGANLAGATDQQRGAPLPTQLAGVSASVNGLIAPLYYVSPAQVNLQIPYEVPTGPAVLAINNNGKVATFRFTVAAAAPGPTQYFWPAGSATPVATASPGQSLVTYITGEGDILPFVASGHLPAGEAVSHPPKPRLPFTMTVGGKVVVPMFVGIPSWSIGVTQVNFTVPADLPPGVYPVVFTVGGVSSPALQLKVGSLSANVQFVFVPPSVPQSADGKWHYTTQLKETAGVGVNLTRLSVFGTDYSDQIANWFRSSRLPANGTLSGDFVASCATCTGAFDGTWQIGGTDDNGNTNTWSGVVHFTPAPKPAAPSALRPRTRVDRTSPNALDAATPAQMEAAGLGEAPLSRWFELLFHAGVVPVTEVPGARNEKANAPIHP